MREFFGEFLTERGFMVILAAILLLTFLGPFGSYHALSLAERFVFWTAAIFCVALPMHLSMRFAVTTPRLGPLPRVLRVGLGATVAALPGAGLVIFISAVLWPAARRPEDFPETWVQVAVIGFIIGCFHYAWFQPAPREAVSDAPDTPAPPAGPGSATSRFHARLDPALGTDIISLTVQDHYVEVTTTRGSALLLIRFSDALAELEGLDGLRIHRSHWVAMPHVEGLARENGKPRVKLSDGRCLPVSQTYAPALRDRLSAR